VLYLQDMRAPRIYTDTSVIGGCLDEEFHVARVPEEPKEFVTFGPEAEALAERYIEAGVVGPGMRLDAQHIPTATVQRVDVLVSWNFKHIVNLSRIHGYNSVNLRQGYPLLEIRSPREVLPYGEA
jgi:hypothetical protein